MAQGSKLAVGAAIGGNFTVMIAKGVAFLFTGSGAMLSEAIHSLADTLNQVLLMVGVVRSSREPDRRYPFGYGAERSVWALISAVGIFFLGCGVTTYHGVQGLLHPHELGALGWAVGVLLLSLVIEGLVLAVALRAVWRAAGDRPVMRYFWHEADPATTAVVMEDLAACLGVLIALGGVLMARATGDSRWDAVGSVLIGLLLGAVAIWLIVRNHHLLVGPAVPEDVRDRIEGLLSRSPLVERVVRLRTRVLDDATFRVSADVEFDGRALAARLEGRLRAAWEEIGSYEDFHAFAARYAEELLEELGRDIDELEAAVRAVAPGARYLDIEAD